MKEKNTQTVFDKVIDVSNKIYDLQNKMDTAYSLSTVLMIAASDNGLDAQSLAGSLYLLSDITNDVCRDLELLQIELNNIKKPKAIAATLKGAAS